MTVFFQIVVIVFLLQKDKKYSILGIHHVNQMSKQQLIASASNNLKYYFETKPNTEFTPLTDNGSLPNIKYKLNSEGFNEKDDFLFIKGEETYRIVTLGDSFTFGLYVDRQDNWTEKLETLLNLNTICKDMRKYEIINLGVPGYDIEYSIERYKLRGQKYDPDLVIWFIKDDDFYDLNEIRLQVFPQVREEMKLSGEYEIGLKNGDPYPVENKVSKMIKNRYDFGRILDLNKNILEEYDFTNKVLVFTYATTNSEFKKMLETYVQVRPNHFFTLVRPKYNPDEFIVGDGHPNEKGHAEIATDLFKYLEVDRQIICN